MRVYSGAEALALKGDELQAAAADLAQSVALYDGWLTQARARLDNRPLDARIKRMDPPIVGATYRHKAGWTTIVHAVDGTTVTVGTPPGSDSGPTQTMAAWYFWRVFELEWPTALEAVDAERLAGTRMGEPMRFEAVVGYTLDGECATWGAGETASDALADACQRFMRDQREYITSGAYEATVYDTPRERRRSSDGDFEVYAWLDRGKATVTVDLDNQCAAGPISWDRKGAPAEAERP